ncbi:hypothetical protein COY62_00350, partial [bacterium (Candidatus Howlettbacteria) CG_4_10_14_0_8_um_filter_40_9]
MFLKCAIAHFIYTTSVKLRLTTEEISTFVILYSSLPLWQAIACQNGNIIVLLIIMKFVENACL